MIRAGGSRVKAVLLYERNIALSEALSGVIQGIEIALRNVLHRQLSSSPYGAMWFDTAPLGSSQAARVIEAKAKLRWVWPHAWSAGSRVELRILDCSPCQGIRKDAMGSADKAFPHAGNKNRFDIHEQLVEIRTLRNRIAHHEPILKLDLPRFFTKTVTALEWICPVSAKWVRSTSCFHQRLHGKPLKYDPPKLPPQPAPPMPGRPI